MEQTGKQNLKKFLLFFLSFFGLGLISKKMPGTFGSMLATVIVLFFPEQKLLLWFAVLTFITGTLLSHYFIITKQFDKNKDPKYIVIDEACGIFLGAFVLSIFNFYTTANLFVNFLLFRFFDILKPFPIKNIEQALKNNPKTVALGIMLDDIIAVIVATFLQILFLKFS